MAHRTKGKSKQMKSMSEQLEAENLAMEQRILALKDMMKKEKEERERLGGTKWNSSNPSNGKNTKPKDKGTNKVAKGPLKFKVLNDQPVDHYLKKKMAVPREESIALSCGQCEKSSAKLECNECGELYCPPCYKQFHTKGALRKHTWKSLDQERKSAGKERKESKHTRFVRVELVDSEIVQTEDSLPPSKCSDKSGGSLLQGNYDENESSASFQKALKDWRSAQVKTPNSKNGMWVNPIKETRSCGTDNPESNEQSQNVTSPKVKIAFEPSLTYAERLALKKSRQDNTDYMNCHISTTHQAFTPSQGRSVKSRYQKGCIESPREPLASYSSSSRSSCGSSLHPIVIPMETQDLKQSKNKEKTTNAKSQSQIINIQLLPSDEERHQLLSSDSLSPVVNEESNSDESNEKQKDLRPTLSQLGRLAIVELSFSDQNEQACESPRSKSASLYHSSTRNNRESPLQQSCISLSPKNQFSPRPPKVMPSSTFVARQKMLMNRHNKIMNGNSVSSNDTAKRILKNKSKKTWKPSSNYFDLSNFFTAGVLKGPSDTEKGDENIFTSVLSPERSHKDQPKISLKIQDIWRPESAISNSESRLYSPDSDLHYLDDYIEAQTETIIRPDSTPIPLPEVKMVIQPPNETPHTRSQPNSIHASDNLLTSTSDNVEGDIDGINKGIDQNLLSNHTSSFSTPRVSLGDYDFLIAPPPRWKGDDLTKLHRASTVTMLGSSPQPLAIDVWNDDSEIESGNTPKSCASPSPYGKHSDDQEDDGKLLEGLSAELSAELVQNKVNTFRIHVDGRGPNWDDDSLSIEDNDDGSGLTSPGEMDVHYDGDSSSADDEYDKEVKNLK